MTQLAKYLAGLYMCTSTMLPMYFFDNTEIYAKEKSMPAQAKLSSEDQSLIDPIFMSSMDRIERYSDILKQEREKQLEQERLEEEQRLKTEHEKYGQVITDYSRFRAEPNYDSEVMFLFRKGMTFEIIERHWNWLKINYNGQEGFIDMSLVEQYQENPPYEVYKEPVTQESVAQESVDGIPHYNPNNLRELSNLSESQIYKMLEGSALQTLSRAYFYAEKEYNVNAIFLMALNSEESGHGRSPLAQSHNNIGGVKDGNSWRYFNDWGESLNYIANLIDKNYLTEGGDYYNGPSIWDVNVKYCEGTTWSGNLNNVVNDLLSKQ